jgi:hypothetical protein
MKLRDFCREQGYDKALLITYDFDALFFERVVLPDLWAGGSSDVQVIADVGQVSQALPPCHPEDSRRCESEGTGRFRLHQAT